jgi:hypothetical protein
MGGGEPGSAGEAGDDAGGVVTVERSPGGVEQ